MVKSFDSQGLGDIAQSWISTGTNKPISAQQISNVLGDGTLQAFAKQAGLPAAEAGGALASLLPVLINQFTPKGEVPQSALLETALGSLLKSLVR